MINARICDGVCQTLRYVHVIDHGVFFGAVINAISILVVPVGVSLWLWDRFGGIE